ncbi:MAG: protein tyrosine phosphatase family protein [Pseudomonadota bacterium]
MNLNTLRTAAGFLGTLIERHTPLKLSKDKPESVFNYLALSDRLATSGQPTRAQFEQIQKGGFQTVINLLPREHENALPGQDALVEALGFEYIYIPVNFKNPLETDFDAFCEAMEKTQSGKVWVHCAANMRVSAFIYRYRVERRGEDEPASRADMEKIWTPYGVWKSFVWRDASAD